jgi:hypothetical protein
MRKHKTDTYYILQYKQFGEDQYTPFDGVTAIKEAVIDKLDSRGWDNKDKVDMRSVNSMANYLYENLKKVIRTKSFEKYLSYLH